MTTFLKNIPIKIPMDLVLSRLKFAKYKTKADKKILSFISEAIEEGYALVEPKVSYEIFDAKISKDRVMIAGTGAVIKSCSLAKHLKDTTKTALFACTIGSRLSEKVNKYVNEGEIARATVLDAVGSEAVEALAEKVDDFIRRRVSSEGYSAVTRFSPGYGDWTVLDQAKILKLLKAGKIGLKATKSCIMVPEKSVTACIGLVRKGPRPIRKVYEEHTKPLRK